VRKSFPKAGFATIVVTNTKFWDVWQPDELYCAFLARSAAKHATVAEIAFETYKKRNTDCLFAKFTIERGRVWQVGSPSLFCERGDPPASAQAPTQAPLQAPESKFVIRRSKRLDLSFLKPYLRDAATSTQ
jgi:hypothetical protein